MEKITVEGSTLLKMQASYLNQRVKGFKQASRIRVKKRQLFRDGEIKILYVVDMVKNNDKILLSN